MTEKPKSPATEGEDHDAMFRDLVKAEKFLLREKGTIKHINGRKYRCKVEPRAINPDVQTGDDIAVMKLFTMEEHYARIKQLIAEFPDGRLDYLAKYLPENNTPQQENNVKTTPQQAKTTPQQAGGNNVKTTQQATNDLNGIMDAIRNYAESMARERGKNVNVSTFIAGINNSQVLNRIMLKAASRISWLEKHPQVDEASPKYQGGKQPM